MSTEQRASLKMAIPALALAAVLLLAHPASAQYAAGGYTGGYSTSSGGYGSYASYGAYYGVSSGILPPIEGLPLPTLPPVDIPVLPPVLGLPLPIGRKLLAANTDEVPRQRQVSTIRGRSLLQSYGYKSGGGYYGSYGSYAVSGGYLYVYGG